MLTKIWIANKFQSYLTVVQNWPIQKLPHNVQMKGKGGGARPLLDDVRKKDAFLLLDVFPKPLLLSRMNKFYIVRLTGAAFNLACMKTKVLLPPWKRYKMII